MLECVRSLYKEFHDELLHMSADEISLKNSPVSQPLSSAYCENANKNSVIRFFLCHSFFSHPRSSKLSIPFITDAINEEFSSEEVILIALSMILYSSIVSTICIGILLYNSFIRRS